MDERKKSIRELEKKKRETLEGLTKLRESWGETVLFRLDAEGSNRFAGELGQYRHFLANIADYKGRIRDLEDNALRMRELEQTLAENGKTAAEKTGALNGLYIRLGEAALQNNAAFDGDPSLKEQADALAAGIGARQEKLGELEEGKSGGFFAWIGGNARSALIRFGLSKSRIGLNRIYASAGEQFFAALEGQGADEGGIPAQIRALREDLALLEESCGSLRKEWETLRDFPETGGKSRNVSPAKKVKELEQRVIREQKQISELCGAFGARLCGLFADAESGGEAGDRAWLPAEDKSALDRDREMRERIAGYEAEIAKLNASLRIDENRDAIDKMKKSMLSHRQRIAASESAIAGLEKQIEQSNRQIEELMKL